MSERDDGGPAFPIADSYDGHGNPAHEGASGMSLRDYFAAQFAARAQSLSTDQDGGWSYENAARCAYEMADAMLAERDS